MLKKPMKAGVTEVSAGKMKSEKMTRKADRHRVESLCCHQMGQANLSVSVAMLGIATSRLADGAVQAMMISHQTGYLDKT